MLNEVIGAVLQIAVFMLIPFIFYAIKYRKTTGFFDFIGLKKSTARANGLAVLACLIFVLPLLLLTHFDAEFRAIMLDPNSITGKFREMGFGLHSVSILLVIALFKTSFAEEVLFRGFIAKRLISVAGFVKGNLLQAFIFGILHTALFASITSNILFLIIIFIMPSVGAYVSVYLNEKLANGSIIPGWISHALANVTAYGLVGFVM